MEVKIEGYVLIYKPTGELFLLGDKKEARVYANGLLLVAEDVIGSEKFPYFIPEELTNITDVDTHGIIFGVN